MRDRSETPNAAKEEIMPIVEPLCHNWPIDWIITCIEEAYGNIEIPIINYNIKEDKK